MDDKYNIVKPRKPETRSEQLQQQIEELINRRDKLTNPTEKARLQKEIIGLFAQYERAKL